MPVFSLGPLGKFQISRIPNTAGTTYASTKSTAARRSSPSTNETPPPYTVHDDVVDSVAVKREPTPEEALSALRLLKGHSQASPLVCKRELLRRYIIEILAMTFSPNFDRLNTALCGSETAERTTSTLSELEREGLFHLSCLVRKTRQMVLKGQASAISFEDKQEIRDAIIEPAAMISRFTYTGAFAMDLIGWYGTHIQYPVQWQDTIPAYWANDLMGLGEFARDYARHRSKESFRAFKGMTHVFLKDNNKAREILDTAADDCMVQCGILPLSYSDFFWLLRPGYQDSFGEITRGWQDQLKDAALKGTGADW